MASIPLANHDPIINHELKLAGDFVQYTGSHIFLTGNAGTGKTTFLHNLKGPLSNTGAAKRMIVTAPTGEPRSMRGAAMPAGSAASPGYEPLRMTVVPASIAASARPPSNGTVDPAVIPGIPSPDMNTQVSLRVSGKAFVIVTLSNERSRCAASVMSAYPSSASDAVPMAPAISLTTSSIARSLALRLPEGGRRVALCLLFEVVMWAMSSGRGLGRAGPGAQ